MDMYNITSQEILDRISRHCPGALSTYLQCINRADRIGKFTFSKQFVEDDLSLNWRRFRNDIKKLALENLLEWHMIEGFLHIRLANEDDE